MMAKFNEDLSVGDRIVLYHMEDIRPVLPGTKGTVKSVKNDPFEPDQFIIEVVWDDGRTLSLMSGQDIWKKIDQEKIDESTTDPKYNYFSKNEEIFNNFDWKFLRNYLYKIRESGIVNMFGSSVLLYCGSEHLERYYGENPPDQEAFDEVLEMADHAKDKMIQGTVKSLEKNNKEINLDNVNYSIGRYAKKIVELYITFD